MKMLLKNKLISFIICLVFVVAILTGCNIRNVDPTQSASKSNVFVKNSAKPTQSMSFDVVTVEKLNDIEAGKAEYDISQYVDIRQVLKRIKKSAVQVNVTLDGSLEVKSGSGIVIACEEIKKDSASQRNSSEHNSASNSATISGDEANTDANYTSFIITCHHVIDRASTVEIVDYIGNKYQAYLVGSDPDSDVCVMSINAKLDPVEFYTDTDLLEMGESVLALGNPLGTIGGTVTSGILSAPASDMLIGDITMSLLQTDAVINAGNTGGGLFTQTGLFIGLVNVKCASSFPDIQGLSFAIDANTVRKISTELVSTSTSEKPGYIKGKYRLGFTASDVDANRWGSRTYVAITSLDPNGCFYKANLNVDDELLSYTYKGNQVTISKAEDFINEMNAINFAIGDKITFRINRKGTIVSLEVNILQYIYGEQ